MKNDGPLIYLPDGSTKQVGGVIDLKKGDIFSVDGGRKQIAQTDPRRIEKDGGRPVMITAPFLCVDPDDAKDLRRWCANIKDDAWSGYAMRSDHARVILSRAEIAIDSILKGVLSILGEAP